MSGKLELSRTVAHDPAESGDASDRCSHGDRAAASRWIILGALQLGHHSLPALTCARCCPARSLRVSKLLSRKPSRILSGFLLWYQMGLPICPLKLPHCCRTRSGKCERPWLPRAGSELG